MIYELYIKSHGEYPDIESEVEADNIREAILKFENIVGDYVNEKDIQLAGDPKCWDCGREDKMVNMYAFTVNGTIQYLCPFCQDRYLSE